ncbi:hypothetical protein J6590_007202 [Homalodisca vitripennis]|nr:hypothetical protein J6590_007202 [Homalodisca vitripennis]
MFSSPPGERKWQGFSEGLRVQAVVESFAKVIGLVFNRGGIFIGHRLPTYRLIRYHLSIVVQLVSRYITTDLTLPLLLAPVFISDRLSGNTKTILASDKKFVKFGKLAYAWSRDYGMKDGLFSSPEGYIN